MREKQISGTKQRFWKLEQPLTYKKDKDNIVHSEERTTCLVSGSEPWKIHVEETSVSTLKKKENGKRK